MATMPVWCEMKADRRGRLKHRQVRGPGLQDHEAQTITGQTRCVAAGWTVAGCLGDA